MSLNNACYIHFFSKRSDQLTWKQFDKLLLFNCVVPCRLHLWTLR